MTAMPVEVILAALATLMAAFTALVIRWAAEAKTPLQGAVVAFLFLMMAAMFGGAVAYYLHPDRTGLVEGLWLAAGLMSLAAFVPFLAFLRAANSTFESDTLAPAPALHKGPTYAGLVAGLVLVNEFLMGWAFSLAAGARFAGLGTVGAIGNGVVAVVDSPWFLFTMAAEMALTAYFLRDRLGRGLVALVGLQAALMLLSPPAFSGFGRVSGVVLAGSVVMIALIVFIMEYLYRHRQPGSALSRYLLAILSVYAAMMAGTYLWLAYGSGLLFASSTLVAMVIVLAAVVRPERLVDGDSTPWLLRPHWTFGVLATIFVGELFMGAVLDIALLPGVYGGTFANLPLAGHADTVAYNAVYNGFWFVAAVTGSTWFLAMMGAEMGILVLFKIRETVSRENKVRLALVMGSYAVFATFFPSYYYTALFPHAAAGVHVPVLGWSMGLGSAPLAPSLFLVIFLTYAVTGSLSVLFGRRVICGVFCTAALMYGGTTFNAMSSFNRSSPVARKYLSSRLSALYSASTGVAMASLVTVSFLSYFGQTGALAISILGADPSVFFFALSFGVLWFLVFVTIPYTGNYNCVTMGWCYTGSIAGAFSRIGFYKLKVRDRAVCSRCTTLDCAKKCPVGLVDMPGHFRQYGEFRSSKCCGVGNCVDACPYGNLYIHDVRHWLRQRFSRATPRSSDTLLPVVRAAPRGTSLPPAAASSTPTGPAATQAGSL